MIAEDLFEQMQDLHYAFQSLQMLIGCCDDDGALNPSDLYYLLGILMDKQAQLIQQLNPS